MTKAIRLLYPGLHIKRWVILGFVGLFLFLTGAGVMMQTRPNDSPTYIARVATWFINHVQIGLRPGTLGAVTLVTGLIVCLLAFAMLLRSLVRAVDPEAGPSHLVEAVYKRKLSQGPRIVVIGGGTGLSTLLRGLKRHTNNLTAIVTVADDGGSSGKLTRQLNILPPGDIRNCLVALADAEPVMTELFQYRFRDAVNPEKPNRDPQQSTGYGEGLRDHAFGNLLIAAMCAINKGDFERAIQETSRVLNIRGSVLPSTVEHVKLCGVMEDGTLLEGETTISSSPLRIKRIKLIPEVVCPPASVLEAIRNADAIILGPGSLFTSIIPNLLVDGIPETIRASKAKKFYVCNVMTQPGESDGLSAYDHVQVLEAHARMRVFDHVLINTAHPSQELLQKYCKSGAVLVEPDVDRIRSANYKAITGNFINQTDVVRHDATLVADAVMKLIN